MKDPLPGHGETEKVAKKGLVAPNRGILDRYHQLCARCKRSCKQGKRIKVIRCPQFEEKHEKNSQGD